MGKAMACSARVPFLLAMLVASGLVQAGDWSFELYGGYTVVGQTADDDRIESEIVGSADLFLELGRGRGKGVLYVEGSSSPRDGGVSTLLPEANADAGTALERDRDGRIQISELKYQLDIADDHTLSVGLLDVTAYLDTTRINNDENQQFLGAGFVNNPSIEFPDYTLGVVYERPRSGSWPRLKLAATSSDGIADNLNLSYSQLLNVTADDKGLFLGAELAWPSPRRLQRVGVWANTSEHETLDGSGRERSNYGLYSVTGASWGRTAANLRIGLADPDVSREAAFAAVTLQREWERLVLGIGAAHSWLSDEIEDDTMDDSLQVEGYLRIQAGRSVFVTPSVQYLIHSDFDASATVRDERVLVVGLRLHQTF